MQLLGVARSKPHTEQKAWDRVALSLSIKARPGAQSSAYENELNDIEMKGGTLRLANWG